MFIESIFHFCDREQMLLRQEPKVEVFYIWLLQLLFFAFDLLKVESLHFPHMCQVFSPSSLQIPRH